MSIINSQPRIGAAGQSTGFKIERSLRFNSADSAYLNRTPASAGNRKTWTWSAWVKRGALGEQTLFNSGGNGFLIKFDTANSFEVYNYSSGTYQLRLVSTAVYRDPSAWYHIVVAIDTTQATSSNRAKIYVNGIEVTALSSSTYPTQNSDLLLNQNSAHYLGVYDASSQYLSGYMADIRFIDGSAKTPSDFGETDTDTGVWKPKAYSGSYGTNGFYLKFADNSGTTSTTLGKDSSGNGNNWTPNNFYVGPGTTNAEKAGIDSLVDTPTPYGTDTGAGGEVRGNYATLNALDYVGTLANGNLDASGTFQTVGTISPKSGKWYFEITLGSMVTNSWIGLYDRGSPTVNNFCSYGINGYGFAQVGFGSPSSTISGSGVQGDVIGFALNVDSNSFQLFKNGVSLGSVTSITFRDQWFVGAHVNASVSTAWSFNFGQRPFAYTAPSGFKALCTQNLPTPTIGATATTRADDYFNTVLYTGDGANPRTITGVGFQPDLVWVKRRNGVSSNFLQDAVRGVTSTDSRSLVSNATDAETNYYTVNGGVTAFTSDGFTTSGGSTNNNLNNSGNTMVAWNWKANGAGSSNTQGTITSTVSANTTSGFSIVTYTGTGANATVGHGLGVAPKWVIVKQRNATRNWLVWNDYIFSLNNGNVLFLDTTDSAYVAANNFNSTAPTSTVFSVGTNPATNDSSATYVAYCFAPVAGYSAFGSYTGNGSTDGPMVFTGFRPAFVMFKASDAVNAWLILDKTRNTYNLVDSRLFPNQNSAEDSASGIDLLSNGFKLRSTNALNNNNGITYVYAAFAEVPQKFSLAR